MLDGRPSDQTVAFFAARAKGGIGLIIAGGTAVIMRSRRNLASIKANSQRGGTESSFRC
jgi:2,4-dienoyl-CoA reductase-like NADH-dependent reductase (Old Yellow Enzyme family)